MRERSSSTASRRPAGRRIASRARGVGIVFQHSRPLHRQTVLENIKLALLPDSLLRLAAAARQSTSARERSRRAVGLGAVMHRHPSTLAFADLRRMEMAKAIARDPKVVLIDEPFAGLTAGEMDAFSGSDPHAARRRPRRAAGGPQRQERRGARRPRARDVPRRVRRRGNGRRGDAQRDGAPRVSRRRDRSGRARAPARRTASRRCSRCATSACSTARRRRSTG